MAREERTVEKCRAAIRSLLRKHTRHPFFNMREEDFRSFLMQKLRTRIKGSVSVGLKKYGDRNLLELKKTQLKRAITSRVHAEVRLIEEKRDSFDIVVLKQKPKSKPVVFRVKQSVTDVLERIELDDVAVVIEIKAAPSNKLHKDFEGDIKKLKGLGYDHPGLSRILVVLDKSIPLDMPSIGEKVPNASWRKSLRKTQKRATDVEVWFLNESEQPDSEFCVGH